MSVVVIDFGMSNLGSVRRSLEECGARVVIADQPAALKQASHAVLPGVGAFARGMENLRAREWVPAIRELALEIGSPFSVSAWACSSSPRPATRVASTRVWV
jgi:glutamine amidotransferase